jgi:hypothetical protein
VLLFGLAAAVLSLVPALARQAAVLRCAASRRLLPVLVLDSIGRFSASFCRSGQSRLVLELGWEKGHCSASMAAMDGPPP